MTQVVFSGQTSRHILRSQFFKHGIDCSFNSLNLLLDEPSIPSIILAAEQSVYNYVNAGGTFGIDVSVQAGTSPSDLGSSWTEVLIDLR